MLSDCGNLGGESPCHLVFGFHAMSLGMNGEREMRTVLSDAILGAKSATDATTWASGSGYFWLQRGGYYILRREEKLVG